MPTRIDMIGVFVKDLPHMVAFYRDLLGFEIHWDGNGPYAELSNDGVRFSMYERALLPGLLGKEVSSPQGLNATFELAIDFPLYEDVDREYARLVASGAQAVLAPRTEPWGMRSSYIADPDGNLIEIGSWGKGQKS
ncbi:MAG TPA: VOC family protein [Anaerolineaceae bacterium]|jgi:lactoylglutathione lyase|nr:VOC family protein [Anaerolineaceae bacterium]